MAPLWLPFVYRGRCPLPGSRESMNEHQEKVDLNRAGGTQRFAKDRHTLYLHMDDRLREPVNPDQPRQQRFSPCQCFPLLLGRVDATARLYAEVFTRDEPTTRWHGITVEDFLPFARRYVRFCATDGSSFIAREIPCEEVIGFILCMDLTRDLEVLGPEMCAFLSRFDATVQLIDALEDQYLKIGTVEPGAVLHVSQLGVSRKARGRSVSTSLIHHVLAFARNNGYRTIIADCTGPLSRRSFENCGFENAGSLRYSDFLFRSTAFFDGLAGEISLMVRDL
jgi:GNAT superfamily N-acetyltransferase